MAIFTLSEINEQMAAYKAALAACASGKDYRIGDRALTRQDLPEIRRHLEWLDRERQALAGQAGPQVAVGRPAR